MICKEERTQEQLVEQSRAERQLNTPLIFSSLPPPGGPAPPLAVVPCFFFFLLSLLLVNSCWHTCFCEDSLSPSLGFDVGLVGLRLTPDWVPVSSGWKPGSRRHLFVLLVVVGTVLVGGSALLTTLLVLRHVQFHYDRVCAINFIHRARARVPMPGGVIELWLEQMMENRAVKFFDGHIFGGRWPGYYDRDYKWWRSSSKLHFSLYLDHSGCLDQGRP